jgi:hypothetical protein
MSNSLVTVYVPLLDEGTAVSRPTQAREVGMNRYELLATDNYDASDETWQFLPGSVVQCDCRDGYLQAIALANQGTDSENK